jgi:radical SAM superfamily enzyme YgiQ (UPF0313 family)
MKIALVNPPPRGALEKHWAEVPILGLAYVAAALREKGHDVVLLDGKLGELTFDDIHAGVVASGAGLIGITCMTVDFPAASRIAERLRRAGLAAPVVLGGAHINAVGAQALAECGAASFACVGEGEHLACELAEALARGQGVEGIAGLARRVGDVVVKNAAREYHDRYDALPFPAWDLFARADRIPLLTHRGCPFECNFCGHNSGFTPRYRSPENVLDEIAHVVSRYAPHTIRFEDETFGLNMPRTKAILHGLIDRGLVGRVRFSAQTRVDRLDLELAQLLRRCGFETLELGVESGSPAVLARMGKGISLAQVERAVRLGKQAGLTIECKFIVGHPHETEAELRETANFIGKINPDRLSVAVMTPYPGTPIFDMAVRGEGGYRLLSRDWASFDKYASGALELEGVSLRRLKAYQMWCYLHLYLRNGRLKDLALLVFRNGGLVREMVTGLASAALAGRRPAAARVPVETPVPLSDVASPDPTLVQLRKRSALQRDTGHPSADIGRGLRTWAEPEPHATDRSGAAAPGAS